LPIGFVGFLFNNLIIPFLNNIFVFILVNFVENLANRFSADYLLSTEMNNLDFFKLFIFIV